MVDATPKKRLFTSEVRRQQRLVETVVGAAPDAPVRGIPDLSGISNAEIMSAIEALRRDIQGAMLHVGQSGDQAPRQGTGTAKGGTDKGGADKGGQIDEAAIKEAALLRAELMALSHAIQETKAEIVALKPPGEQEDRLHIVADELDEVVKSTERATVVILESTERIDELAQSIRLAAADEHEREMADEIMERCIKVYESCNFQDLTGQRITKVVNTLKFVEERIESMIRIWGGTGSLAGVQTRAVTEKTDDEKLLNGPQKEGHGISQNEIDQLFD